MKIIPQSGFSLVEVLVAISILLLAVVGPMAIISRATTSTTFATEQATAFFLAQEGLEIVQYLRDSRVLKHFEYQYNQSGAVPTPMSEFETTYSQCLNGAVCGVHIDTLYPVDVHRYSCSGNSVTNCRLYIDQESTNSSRPVYRHVDSLPTTLTASPYTRTIRIERVPATGAVREYKVISTVTWRSGNQISDQRVELVTYLTNTYGLN